MWTNFQNSFTRWFVRKFSMYTSQRFLPHPQYVATLPCESQTSKNVTETHIFEFLTPLPPAPQGPMDPRGGRGTSADIVPIHMKYGLDPCTRWWDIAQKPPKCQNFTLTHIVTKISFPTFSARRGPPTPKRGEDTSGTRVRSYATFGLNRPAGCREIVNQTKKQRKHIN